MPALSNSRHEAFAQARFSGLSVMDAYRAAGYEGATPQVASAVSQHPEVKARLRELHNKAATIMAYEKDDALRDLVSVIKGRPCEASAANPLCEPRSSKNGPCYRFPSKLRAMARLIRIMGWAGVVNKQGEAADPSSERMRNWIIEIRRRGGGYTPPNEEDYDPDEIDDLSYLKPEKARALAAASADRNAALNPKQEAFAQARARGLGIMRSYQLAGYMGHSGKCAYRVNERAAVQARIAELRQIMEAAPPDESYHKHHAANDLIAIIQASPAEASAEQPLCEMRIGHQGPYYRFPCKLQALTLLARLMHWNAGDKSPPPQPAEGLDDWDRFMDNETRARNPENQKRASRSE